MFQTWHILVRESPPSNSAYGEVGGQILVQASNPSSILYSRNSKTLRLLHSTALARTVSCKEYDGSVAG